MNPLAIAVLLILAALFLRVIADRGWAGFLAWLAIKFGPVGPPNTSTGSPSSAAPSPQPAPAPPPGTYPPGQPQPRPGPL